MPRLTRQQDFENLLFRDADGRYGARFGDYQLHSVFQPLFYRGGSLFGHEALLRVFDGRGQALPPHHFFAGLDHNVAVDADRLARVIHLRNFAQGRHEGCISVNIMPQTLIRDTRPHGLFELLQRRVDELGLDRAQVILEVQEHDVAEREAQMIDCLRVAAEAGFGIAVDDFGAMASNHRRVQALRPDIIKLDRSLLLDHMAGDTRRLPALLEYGWQIGSRMLVEGVESAEQHQAMQALGVELYQGFHLGRPAALPVVRLL